MAARVCFTCVNGQRGLKPGHEWGEVHTSFRQSFLQEDRMAGSHLFGATMSQKSRFRALQHANPFCRYGLIWASQPPARELKFPLYR